MSQKEQIITLLLRVDSNEELDPMVGDQLLEFQITSKGYKTEEFENFLNLLTGEFSDKLEQS